MIRSAMGGAAVAMSALLIGGCALNRPQVKALRDRDANRIRHLVLADPDHPRDHMVVESGDPDYHGNARSPNRDRIRDGRRMFDAFVAQSGVRHLSELNGRVVRVSGVGFFDMNHLQLGRSGSCIELHPLLSLEGYY